MREFINIVTENAVAEQPIDYVHGVLEEFDAGIDDDVANEHYVEDQGVYLHLFVGGQPSDGFTPEYAQEIATELDKVLRPHGWFVAKRECKYNSPRGTPEDEDGDEAQLMCFIDVFPMFGTKITGDDIPDVVYHVCRPEHTQSILTNGLIPRTGGSDHIVTANPRIYVALDRAVLRHIETDMWKLRGWDSMDVIAISTAGLSNSWYEDVEMEGHSAWTPDPIPASHLKFFTRM